MTRSIWLDASSKIHNFPSTKSIYKSTSLFYLDFAELVLNKKAGQIWVNCVLMWKWCKEPALESVEIVLGYFFLASWWWSVGFVLGYFYSHAGDDFKGAAAGTQHWWWWLIPCLGTNPALTFTITIPSAYHSACMQFVSLRFTHWIATRTRKF